MSNDEMQNLAELVRSVVKEELSPVREKLEATFDQVADLTVKVDVEIIPKLEEHTRILKKHSVILDQHTLVLDQHTLVLERLESRSNKNTKDIKKLKQNFL